MISIAAARGDADLEGILQLQQRNLRRALTPESIASEGFVTLEHDLDLLRAMNSPFPHIVAKEEDTVVGYALVMERWVAPRIPDLAPLFAHIDRLEVDGVRLAETRYVVMGQVCVDRAYRGQGLFRRIYAAYGRQLRSHFDYVLTEISGHNQRSRDAHLHVGFEVVDRYSAPDGSPWLVVGWAL